MKCYYCLSTLNEDCGDPFPDYGDRSTCIGDVCYKAKYENEGTLVIKQGCNHWGSEGVGPPPRKNGRTTPTFLMKTVITVT